jgi:uncharacterized protein with GYD domain
MPTFIRLDTLTEEGIKNVKNFSKMLAEAKEIMERHGVILLHGWATLGEYDVIAVVDAPDAKTAAQVSALIAARGNFHTKTLAAIALPEFGEVLKEG